MARKRILVITNAGSFDGSLVKWLADCWTNSGYRVDFTSDLNTKKEADIALLHVDLTQVPSSYIEFTKRFPIVINAYVSSISKETFSQQILEKYSKYEGRVIVKTTANYGGLPEIVRENIPRINQKLIHLTRKLALSEKFDNRFIKSLLWKNVRVLDPGNYPIFDSLDNISSGVWKNSNLIVEKFLPERNPDGRYVLRHWYFFGNKEFNRTLVSKNPIPKWCSMTEKERTLSREEWRKIEIAQKADIPKEVRDVREKLRMDFGRIDWAMHDGKPIIFDANKTPGGIGVRSLDSDLDLKRHAVMCKFSQGIEYFMN